VCGCVLQCVAVCCSVLHCVAVCCSVLQCDASVLQCVAIIKVPSSWAIHTSVQCLAIIKVPFAWAIHTNQETKGVEIHRVCCSALQCVAVCCSVL